MQYTNLETVAIAADYTTEEVKAIAEDLNLAVVHFEDNTTPYLLTADTLTAGDFIAHLFNND